MRKGIGVRAMSSGEFRNDRPTSGEVLKVDLDLLGMEARSIFRSIRTEQSKLAQSDPLAKSDLSYFQARHNYYRLSLKRLDPLERQILEPVLAKFHQKINEFESGSIQREAPTPFLAPVQVPTTTFAKPEVSEQVVEETPSPSLDAILAELELVQIALSAEASNDRNQVIRSAISRVQKRLNEGLPR